MDEEGYAGATQLRRLLDAVVAVSSGLSLPDVLHRVVETAVDLVGANYGALGVLSPDRTRLDEFITVGLTNEQVAAIGRRPEGHGILGLLIVDPRPLRLPDLNEHSARYGFPSSHPAMTSFLGVPVFVRGTVFGNLYLTDKHGGEAFTAVDEELVVGLAGAAGVAIDNARLHERVREVDLLEDRDRIARDLHDTVIQRMFATGLSLQGAARLADRPEVLARIQQAVEDIDVTVRQVRSAIFELQSVDLSGRSLRRDLLGIGIEMAPALGFDPAFRLEGAIDSLTPDDVGEQLLAVVREALANVARHARARRVEVVVAVRAGALTLTVADDGVGPGPARGGRGIANIVERANRLGGEATVTERATGGTEVCWRVPLERAP